MEEPKRIGLTAVTTEKLDELHKEINPGEGEEGVRLIKLDIYRLAVAIGVKKGVVPLEIEGEVIRGFRVGEFDEDGIIFAAVEGMGIVPKDVPIYEYIQRLAEEGITEFYRAYNQMGQLPLEEYFTE